LKIGKGTHFFPMMLDFKLKIGAWYENTYGNYYIHQLLNHQQIPPAVALQQHPPFVRWQTLP
jgi:hypothetical protein